MGRTRGKGEGSVYKDAQGRWTASLDLPPDPLTGRRRRKVVRARTKTDVVRRLREAQVELARSGDIATGRPLTVAQWMDRWIDRDVAPVRKPATTADYRAAARAHIVPAIGRLRLDRITPTDVRAVHTHVIKAGSTTTTASKVHRVLRAALAAAEREGLVARNVARLVPAPPTSTRPPRAMTAAEARAFLEARRQRGDYARWATSILLGARQGEVLGLTLDNLHLDTDLPHVDLAWELRRVTWAHGCGSQRSGSWPCGRARAGLCPDRIAPVPAHMDAEQVHGGLWLLRPKTTGSWRRVAVPTVLADALALHIQTAHPRRFLFEEAPAIPIEPRRDHRAWQAALAQEGLPPMRLHSARHTAATLLLEAGVPVRTAQEILGQTQALTTARYQHPGLDTQRTALDALAAAIA